MATVQDSQDLTNFDGWPDARPHRWQLGKAKDPWRLTWADKSPVVWRLGQLRCRLLERREEGSWPWKPGP